jgi:metabotropic X receptor
LNVLSQIRHADDETQCKLCPQGTLPDTRHTKCEPIPEVYLRADSGWAIGAMAFSATGIAVTALVAGVFLRHHDTPVVRASGRELSYILLLGIFLCYAMTFVLVLKPNDIVCGMQRFDKYLNYFCFVQHSQCLQGYFAAASVT